MDTAIKISEIKAKRAIIAQMLEDLINVDGTTQVHLKYLNLYDDLGVELKELQAGRIQAAA